MQQNQNTHEQINANETVADAPTRRDQSQAIRLATAVLGAAEARGEQARGIAKLLQKHPEWEDEIFAFLHDANGFGNRFVGLVINAQLEVGSGADDKKQAAPAAPDDSKNSASTAPASKAEAAAAQSELGPPPPGGWKAPKPMSKEELDATLDGGKEKPQMDAASQAPAPAPPVAAQGPTPGPQSAEAKQEEPAPQKKDEVAPPTNEVAPPGKQDVAAATQGPAPAPPAQEAAPKADAKAEEKGKDEKPEEKADGAMVKITASALRVRAEPSLKGAVLGKIPRGKTAKVVGHEGAWLKIEWGQGTAFIHSKYTTSVKGNEGGEEEEQEGEQSSHEQKQERPKAPPMVNDDQQQGVLV